MCYGAQSHPLSKYYIGYKFKNIAYKKGYDVLSHSPSITYKNIKALFSFGKDEKINNKKLEVNSLSKPMLIQYYSEAVANWN